MIDIILPLILGASACLFAFRRSLTFLLYLQQEDYIGARFLAWVVKNYLFDRKVSLGLMGLLVVALLWPHDDIVALTASIFLIFMSWCEADPRKIGKKKLVVTQRAQRILIASNTLLLIATVSTIMIPSALYLTLGGLIVLIQLIPLFLVVGNALLTPVEKSIQNKLTQQAQAKLAT